MILFVVSLLGLGALVGGLSLAGIDPFDSLSAACITLCGLAWVVAYLLRKASKLRPNGVIHERVVIATRDAALATIIAIFGLWRLTGVPVPRDVSTLMLLVVILGICLYPLRWLVWFWRGDFDK